MKHLLLVLAIISISLAGHNIRHNKQNQANSQKALVQTQEIEYIDDDKQYVDPSEIAQKQSELVQETQIESEQQQEIQQEQIVQSNNGDVILSNQELDKLDAEEQKLYEEEKKKQLEQHQGQDEDNYMSALNVSVQTQDPSDFMPVDVVENELHPVFEKDNIPDQKGVDSPFLPADGSSQMVQDEPEYEIKPVQMMPDEIPAEQLAEYMQKIQAKEEQEMAILAAQGPK